MICHAERLPDVPIWLLRLFHGDAAFGAPFDAVCVALEFEDHISICGLLSGVPFTRAHRNAVIAALWNAGLRGSLTWERSKFRDGAWVRVPVRATISDQATR